MFPECQMGYGTHFGGRLTFKDERQLTEAQWTYLRLFTAYCHFDVRKDLAEQAEDPVRAASGLPLGPNCCFFLDSGVLPEEVQKSMLLHGNYKSQQPLAVYSSKRHKTLPSYYCHWRASFDRRGIEWRDNGVNRVYDFVHMGDAVKWLQFLVRLLLEQWGLEVQGEIWFQGKYPEILGRLYIDERGTVTKEHLGHMQNILGFAAAGDVAAMQRVFADQSSMVDGWSRTPFMLALLSGRLDAAVWLLQQPGGARLDAVADLGFWEMAGRASGLYTLAKLWPEHRDFSRFVSLLPSGLPQELFCNSDAGAPPLCEAIEQHNLPLVRWLLRNGADLMSAGSHLISREGGRAPSLHLTGFLHQACMTEGGAELVDPLVRAGAQMECRRAGLGTAWRSKYWEATPLFKAARVARYDSVQELVWQGASLKAPCTARAHQTWWQETTSGPPCHDAELEALLHTSTYKVLQDLDGQEAHYTSYVLGPFRMHLPTLNLLPTTSLLSFKSAVEAGLERRRLLVLAVLSVQPGPQLPADALQDICRLAELVL